MADQDTSSKKIRKGTRSCQECRRRKKHCIWPEGSSSCSECIARGTPCLKQQVSQSKRAQQTTAKNLQDRVAQLENALQTLDPSGGNARSGSISDHSSPPAFSRGSSQNTPIEPPPHSESAHNRLDNAPVASLFKNSILRGQDESSCDEADCTEHASHRATARARVLQEKRQRLLAAFPPPEVENMILNADLWAWKMWAKTFSYLFGLCNEYEINQLVTDCKNGPTVSHVAKALLCVSISLLEAGDGVTSRYGIPTQARQEMLDRQQAVVAEVLFTDEELCTTLEGLECFVLQMKFDINLGRLRKGWIDTRRAIAFAQLLGYQRLSEPIKDDVVTHRKRGIWRNLYTTDRWSSLLTGLPSCIAESAGTAAWASDPSNSDQRYFITLTNVIGHIVDRNQEPPNHRTLSKTIQIEGELADLAATMPESWWELQKNAPLDVDVMSLRIIPQFWHHQARLLLHLPYMLKANTDRRYEYHRIAALESSRSMIQLFRMLRPAQGFGSHLCKVIDFQVFTAGMVLVLEHFGNQQAGSTTPPAGSQSSKDGESDHDLLLATLRVMRAANSDLDESVVKEASKALEIFTNAWDNAATLASQGPNKVFIPYYGPVVFGDFAKAAANAQGKNKAQQAQDAKSGRALAHQTATTKMPLQNLHTAAPSRDAFGLPTPSTTGSDAASTASSSRQQQPAPLHRNEEMSGFDFTMAIGKDPSHPSSRPSLTHGSSTSIPSRSSSNFPTPSTTSLQSPPLSHEQAPFSIADQPLTAYNPAIHSQQREIWNTASAANQKFPTSNQVATGAGGDNMDFAWGDPFATAGQTGGVIGMDLDFSGDDWSWFWDNTQIGPAAGLN